MSEFAGSNASASAGSESVTKFIHNMCIGSNISKCVMSVIPNQLANNGVNNVAKNKTLFLQYYLIIRIVLLLVYCHIFFFLLLQQILLLQNYRL